MQNFLTVEEAAHHLKVDPETVRRWLREGTMRGLKFGRVWRIPESELALTSCEVSETPAAAGRPQPA